MEDNRKWKGLSGRQQEVEGTKWKTKEEEKEWKTYDDDDDEEEEEENCKIVRGVGGGGE